MSIADTLALAKRTVLRGTVGLKERLEVKQRRAENQDRIADLVNLRTRFPATLQPEDFQAAGQAWDVEPAIIHALSDIESGALHGFDARGRMIILVEPHIFSALSFHAFDTSHPHLSYPEWTPYRKDRPPPGNFPAHPYTYSQDDRWGLFAMMAELNLEAALGAMSCGRFQQVVGSPRPNMGWKLLRYASAEQLFRKLAASEPDQLDVLHTFIEANGLKPALRARDWLTITRVYNGPGNAVVYAAKAQAAYKQRARIYNV